MTSGGWNGVNKERGDQVREWGRRLTVGEQVGSGDPTHLALGLKVRGNLGKSCCDNGTVQTGQEGSHCQSGVIRKSQSER